MPKTIVITGAGVAGVVAIAHGDHVRPVAGGDFRALWGGDDALLFIQAIVTNGLHLVPKTADRIVQFHSRITLPHSPLRTTSNAC